MQMTQLSKKQINIYSYIIEFIKYLKNQTFKSVGLGLIKIFMFILLQTLIALTQACGSLTHLHVAYRAKQIFKSEDPYLNEIIQKHPESLITGSSFPDWLYACGNDHDAGEAAHWPPFHQEYIDYIHEKYPQPWNELQEKKIAFLMGMATHSLSDINWHGLRQRQGLGFLRTMGVEDYECNGDLCDTAHHEGDAGGDFIAAQQMDTKLFSEIKEWQVPTDDLVEIFKRQNFTVKPESINQCSILFYLEGLLIENFGKELEKLLETRTQFLTDNYYDFYIGGMDDMVAMTTYNWLGFEKMIFGKERAQISVLQDSNDKKNYQKSIIMQVLEEVLIDKLSPVQVSYVDGISTIYLDKSKTFSINFIKLVTSFLGKLQKIIIQKNKDLTYVEIIDSMLTELKELAIDNITNPIEDVVNKVKNWFHHMFGGSSLLSLVQESSYPNYSYYGEKIIMTEEYDIISAPNYSERGLPSIGLIKMTPRKANLKEKVIKGEKFDIKCGAALIAMDFNQDGIEDLVYSCPGFGKINMENFTNTYTGKVKILLGGDKGEHEIIGKELSYFGSTLNKIKNGDFEDLVIGSPYGDTQRGWVHVIKSGNYQDKIIPTPEPVLIGEAYSHLGAAIATCGDKLVVSAPDTRNSTLFSFGSVFVYILKENSLELQQNYTSQKTQSQSGSALYCNDRYLFVGQPAFKQMMEQENGQVLVIKLDGQKGDFVLEEQAIQTIYQENILEKFGDFITGEKDWVLIGAPQRSNKGAVYVYQERDGSFKKVLEWKGEKKEAFYGGSIAILGERVLVSSKRDDNGGKQNGSVEEKNLKGQVFLK